MNKLPYFMARARFTSSTTNRECMANLFPPISRKKKKTLVVGFAFKIIVIPINNAAEPQTINTD